MSGRLVDNCLSWKDHCDHLYSKLNLNKCLIVNVKNLLSFTYLQNMSLKSSQNSLYRLQKNCLRHMLGKNASYNTDELFKSSKIIRFPDMTKQDQQQLGYKISHCLLPEPIQKLFNEWGGKKHTNTPQEIKWYQTYNCITTVFTMPASCAKAFDIILIFQA